MLDAPDAAAWTAAERDLLPRDGNRYELVGGELFVTPPPSMRHQLIVSELFQRLEAFVREQQLGTVLARETHVIRGEQDDVIPDVAVYPFKRKTPPKSWADAPRPVLVAEVRSSVTWRRDIGPKRQLYVALGIPDYWIVNPGEHAITLVRAARADERVTDHFRWEPADSKHSLEIDVATLLR
jgi:Uma2 family endonuclease